MANIKISQLTTATPLTGAELVPVVQSGGTVQTEVSALKVFALVSIQPEVSALQQSLVSVNTEVSLLKSLPFNVQSSAYVPVVTDNGRVISITSGGVTVPAGVFSQGQAFTILNDSTSVRALTQGVGVTLRWAGTSATGSRSIGPYGLTTIICANTSTFYASGAGLY